MADKIYKEVLRLPTIEVCEVMRLTAKSFLLREIFELAKKMIPGVVHECPYEGVSKNFIQFFKLFDLILNFR